MKVTPTDIPDVIILEPKVHGDHRGYFMETWRKSAFEELGVHVEFVQDNQSRSGRGILRGLHYQLRKPQGKLVRVLSGEIFDVAVDLRRHSPSFGQWVGVILSDSNHRQLWVPPGFAHGFYVMSASADIAYKCTAYYAPEDERGLRWNDPRLNIQWPLVDEQPVLSGKDANASLFGEAEVYEWGLEQRDISGLDDSGKDVFGKDASGAGISEEDVSGKDVSGKKVSP